MDYKNCHAKGVDSIILSITPMIRFFYAHKNHKLWKIGDVGFHSHKTRLRIKRKHGLPRNHFFKFGTGKTVLRSFDYKSAIVGSGEFKDNKIKYHGTIESFEFDDIILNDEYHTITVPKGESASWVVYELDQNCNYRNLTLSTKDLTKFSFKNMYIEMNKEQTLEILKQAIIGV